MKERQLFIVMDDTNNIPIEDIPRLSAKEEAELDRMFAELHESVFDDSGTLSDLKKKKLAIA